MNGGATMKRLSTSFPVGDTPLDEYPRPQMVRAQWQNLNGLWPVSYTHLDAGGVTGDERIQPRSFSDIAILYRTHRQADILEYCLQKENIPYTVAGRDSFLSEPAVRAAIGFFRFLLAPGDTHSLQTALELGWACSPQQAVRLSAFFPGCSALHENLWDKAEAEFPELPMRAAVCALRKF